ncbi:MAG TPA: hypothetical protein ENK15_02735 [Thermopetrobacter sp.]|nr:hypothetical protein [Thermopetrobacter sp.]
MKAGLKTVMLALAVMAAPALAGDVAPKVPIDRSKGECVLPGPEMRRQHMELLKHRRDATMYDGVRGGKVAFAACLNCHAVKGDDGKPVTVKSPQHFCRVCHDYTAVKVDCWSCHVSVPRDGAGKQALRPPHRGATDFAALKKYLKEGRK